MPKDFKRNFPGIDAQEQTHPFWASWKILAALVWLQMFIRQASPGGNPTNSLQIFSVGFAVPVHARVGLY
jgi:hypothetical protein